MRQIPFFALGDEIVAVLEAIEARSQVAYVRTGHYERPEALTYQKGTEIPDLGRALSSSAASCTSYVVCDRTTQVQMRRIARNDGTVRFSVDQLLNEDTVVFTPAGLWDDSVLLHGRVATVSDTQPAQKLMKLFSAAIRTQFTRVKAFYVSPKALAMLKSGKRLTSATLSPHEFDLSLLP